MFLGLCTDLHVKGRLSFDFLKIDTYKEICEWLKQIWNKLFLTMKNYHDIIIKLIIIFFITLLVCFSQKIVWWFDFISIEFH